MKISAWMDQNSQSALFNFIPPKNAPKRPKTPGSAQNCYIAYLLFDYAHSVKISAGTDQNLQSALYNFSLVPPPHPWRNPLIINPPKFEFWPKLVKSPFRDLGNVSWCKKSEKSDHRFTRYRDFKIERSDWPREGDKSGPNFNFDKISQFAF